jgi:subtilase family serine protease
MKSTVKLAGLLAVALVFAACNANAGYSSLPSGTAQSRIRIPSAREARLWGPNVIAACPDTHPGWAHCFALIRTGPAIVKDGATGPNGGFTPAQLEAAYNLPSATKGAGQLVAIVDPDDDPNAGSDLATYRSYFGLPAANFTKYNQTGQIGNYPAPSVDNGAEESLDVDMVSASCPNCSIALVEANSGSASDLEAAEATAVSIGAHIISNSWGCYTPCGLSKSSFDAPGVTYVGASGDDGYGSGVGTPEAFSTFVEVGGTSLYVDKKAKRGYQERVWLGTNSGCSDQPKPSWQGDPGCSFRTANDIAALADPATGPAIYDSYGFGGWLVGGGTSTGSPFISGVFALAGNASSQDGGQTFWERKHEKSSMINAITKGYNGSCTPTYLCTDGTHEYKTYGGPTGWGSPNGIGAF